MANKLISQLGVGPILVTDLLEHEPLAGPPSQQGDVTALFSDASSVLAVDRDNRQLWDAAGSLSADWNTRQLLSTGGLISVDWAAHQLSDSVVVSVEWSAREMYDAAGIISIDWTNRLLTDSTGTLVFDWENPTALFADRQLTDSGGLIVLDWDNLTLIDTTAAISADWENRILFASDGTTTVLDFSTQQSSSGPQTAGAVYTATEQTMIQEMYDALLAYGLLSP